MKKINSYLLNLINLVVSFIICRWLFMRFLYFYFISIFGFPESGLDFWRPLLVIFIMSFVLFTLLRSLDTKKLDIRLVKITYGLYFMVLLYAILFKNIGLQGSNLNLISFIKDTIFIDAKVPLLNLLIFVPAGALFRFRYKNIIFFLVSLLTLETLQYVFHLGFFDIGDIFTNTIGLIIGNLLHDSIIGQRIIQSIKK